MPVSFPRRSGRLHQRPEMFEAWVPRFPRTNGDLAGAVDGLVKIYRDFVDAARKGEADESVTPGAKLVRNAKNAYGKIIPGVERLNKVIEATDEVAAHLRAETSKAYNPPSPKYDTVIRHQEIRAHFKSLSPQERFKQFEGARRSDDEDTLIALASTQSYLSGLPNDLHQSARDTLVQKYAPEQAAALESLSEQQKSAAMLRDTMLQSVADLIDLKKADEIMAAASTELAP